MGKITMKKLSNCCLTGIIGMIALLILLGYTRSGIVTISKKIAMLDGKSSIQEVSNIQDTITILGMVAVGFIAIRKLLRKDDELQD